MAEIQSREHIWRTRRLRRSSHKSISGGPGDCGDPVTRARLTLSLHVQQRRAARAAEVLVAVPHEEIGAQLGQVQRQRAQRVRAVHQHGAAASVAQRDEALRERRGRRARCGQRERAPWALGSRRKQLRGFAGRAALQDQGGTAQLMQSSESAMRGAMPRLERQPQRGVAGHGIKHCAQRAAARAADSKPCRRPPAAARGPGVRQARRSGARSRGCWRGNELGFRVRFRV